MEVGNEADWRSKRRQRLSGRGGNPWRAYPGTDCLPCPGPQNRTIYLL